MPSAYSSAAVLALSQVLATWRGHRLRPLHTPHSSISFGLTQHTPPASSSGRQQLPAESGRRASLAVAVHSPHALR